MARILIASDVARTRISITGALTRAGHIVDRVTHLRLAAAHADIHQVDAVLIDLDHPFQQEQLVTSLRARSQVPVIVLTDTLRAWATKRLLGLGTEVMTPPFTDDDIVARLGAMLSSASHS